MHEAVENLQMVLTILITLIVAVDEVIKVQVAGWEEAEALARGDVFVLGYASAKLTSLV